MCYIIPDSKLIAFQIHRGETRGLILARGIFASSLLAGVVAFFYINIFTGAFQELQFIPTQNTRIPGAVSILDFGVTTIQWGVTIVSRQIG